ncbi:TIGR00341 family protein [Halosimplex pelagicum]|uniref:TIGR00341 family protein n=1 Tax=Halosimplex pelagicum TaxID=869886 RepID=A0A7D5P406_9EURY|nr:TIGR00341 family protein [Halosimplex pelagicum]QLH80197.1 TIGR00341 family protein [Halosimplex pelagicum]
MRLVQITIPTGKRETVTRALDDEGLDYIVTDETSGREYAAVAYVPLPTNAVEPVLDTLRTAGIDESTYTVVLDAETVVSDDFEELEERYAEEENGDRIAREELVAAAKDLLLSTPAYLLMTVVSAVIATAGLLLNSPAVIVGSMVIAPLIGPAMAASVGTVVVDDELFARGVKLQAVGLAVSIASAAAFAWLVKTVHLIPPFTDVTAIPQVRSRLYPDFLSLVVALGAGIAGAISLTAGISSAIVGVMIAVALIPPAATVGIGIAWGKPVVSLGSGVLVLVNLLSINLAALIVLRYSGYRPTNWFQLEEARGATIRRVGVLVVAIVALSVFLGGVTYDSFQGATTEERIQEATNAALDESGASAEVLSMEVNRSGGPLLRHPVGITVTVGVDDHDHPALAERIDRRVERAIDREVQTQVRYVVTDSA